MGKITSPASYSPIVSSGSGAGRNPVVYSIHARPPRAGMTTGAGYPVFNCRHPAKSRDPGRRRRDVWKEQHRPRLQRQTATTAVKHGSGFNNSGGSFIKLCLNQSFLLNFIVINGCIWATGNRYGNCHTCNPVAAIFSFIWMIYSQTTYWRYQRDEIPIYQ